MLDPAAMGTLIIGLRSAQAEFDLDSPARNPRPGPDRPGPSFRPALARLLRLVADRLEPASLETEPC